jgi:pimeloyl-ACP methyl ester carboxylesterase
MDYSQSTHGSDIARCSETLGLADFALVGMSLAGLNSIEFASRDSDRLKALALVDVGPELRSRGDSADKGVHGRRWRVQLDRRDHRASIGVQSTA